MGRVFNNLQTLLSVALSADSSHGRNVIDNADLAASHVINGALTGAKCSDMMHFGRSKMRRGNVKFRTLNCHSEKLRFD